MARCGVTVITGGLGAGKTTVLRSLVDQFGIGQCAVVSNDLTRIDHDARLLREHGLQVISLAGECGTQRPEAVAVAIDQACARLAGRTGRIVVELAGLGSTGPLLGALESVRSPRWAVDGVVSVFDARTLLDDRLEVDFESTQQGELSPGGLIEEQIAASTTVVLNHAQGLSSDELADMAALVDRLNPDASIETTLDGQVRASTMIDPVWSGRAHKSDRAACIAAKAMVFDAHRPMHPGRLHDAVQSGAFLGVRSKGIAWLATRHHNMVRWDQVGFELKLQNDRAWWASTPPAQWPAYRTQWASIFDAWQSPWGDRRQLISLVGMGLDRARVASALNACLLSDAELAEGRWAWAQWHDPMATQQVLRIAA